MPNPFGLVDKTLADTSTWSFDPVKNTYRVEGRTRTPEQVKRIVEARIIEPARRELRRLTEAVRDGRISPEVWFSEMAQVLAYLHGLAATAAHGNVRDLLERARLDVQSTIEAEQGYLRVFRQGVMLAVAVAQSEPGPLLAAASLITLGSRWLARASSYADAGLITFERHRLYLYELHGYREVRRTMHPEAEHCDGCEHEAAKGWVPLPLLVPLGYEQCGQWCKCSVEYRREATVREDRMFGRVNPEMRRTEWAMPI